MKKFKCSICGYTYDESAGLPEKGIAPGTQWNDIAEDFVCPWCGAPKSVFEEVKEKVEVFSPVVPEEEHAEEEEHVEEDLRELSAGELSALCSNLAKGCEKQHLSEEMNLFYQLSDYYKGKSAPQRNKNFGDSAKLLNDDLSEGYPNANKTAAAKSDRGALRALVWSEKVSRMLSSLLSRYAKEGNALLENTKIYVCDICGFVYLGNDLPEICPVCKVPNFKISQIGRR